MKRPKKFDRIRWLWEAIAYEALLRAGHCSESVHEDAMLNLNAGITYSNAIDSDPELFPKARAYLDKLELPTNPADSIIPPFQ